MCPGKRGIRGPGPRLRAAVAALGLAAAGLAGAGAVASGPAAAGPCRWSRQAAVARAS
jgi:hypothetical protein